MFFNNSSQDDPYGDIQRREEYERQQKLQLAKGLGTFFYKYMAYSFIWLFTTAFTATVLETIFKLSSSISLIVGIIAGIGIFRVPYVKENPLKSFVVICFVFGLFIIAF